MKNLIQIAGVRSIAEAKMLLDSGADYIGFPLRLAYHKPDLTEQEAAEIISSLDCGAQSILITYLDNAREVNELCRFLGVHTVQLHGSVSPAEVSKLHQLHPDLKIIKSLIVRSGNFDELQQTVDLFADLADAFITDTYDPKTGATGATGQTHDWSVSRRLVEYSPKPLILAGGLNHANIGPAILTVRPAGVDAHTGLENINGWKDVNIVRHFISTARNSFKILSGTGPKPITIPINGVLDLHTFSPREIKDLIPEYLEACRDKDILDVRIIHGKGIGALREAVHAILYRQPYIEKFQMADDFSGGWGATGVRLKHKTKPPFN